MPVMCVYCKTTYKQTPKELYNCPVATNGLHIFMPYEHEPPRILEFIELLDKMKAIYEKKNKDYASISNPYENFERSAILSSWFSDSVDKSFVNLIGTKLARLATLLNKTKDPENESIEDSFLDLCTYCALWSSYYSSKQLNQKPRPSQS